MQRTGGSPDVKVGLIDGPVATKHSDLASEHLREIPGSNSATCTQANSAACVHGTFVAGILSAKRNSRAPAISPDCTLLIRPIFSERTTGSDQMPSATPQELAAAIVECIDARARVINLSLALAQPSTKGEQSLEEALNQALRQSVIVVAAAGNQGTLGSSAITSHPWVIPVVACDLRGRPVNQSNLGGSIGRRGLTAPGEAITSLSAEGPPLTLAGICYRRGDRTRRCHQASYVICRDQALRWLRPPRSCTQPLGRFHSPVQVTRVSTWQLTKGDEMSTMNMPGFTADFAVSTAGRGYLGIANALTDDSHASVLPARTKVSGPGGTQCELDATLTVEDEGGTSTTNIWKCTTTVDMGDGGSGTQGSSGDQSDGGGAHGRLRHRNRHDPGWVGPLT
jgi:subtilisin family serine protease